MKRHLLILIVYTGLSFLLTVLLREDCSTSLRAVMLAGMGAVVFFFFRKDLVKFQFLALLLALISIVVAYSTFKAQSQIYSQFWFNSLLVLLLVSLIACVINFKAKDRLRYSGYLGIHLGLVVVGLGFIINGLTSEKCYLSLFKGKITSACQLMKEGKVTQKMKKLPFEVELKDFQVKFYKQQNLIIVYKRKKQKYSILKTISAEPGKKARFADFSVKVLSLDEGKPIRTIKRVYIVKVDKMKVKVPEGKIVNVEGKNIAVLPGERKPFHFLIVRSAAGVSFYIVSPGREIVIEDKMALKIIRFYPDFKYDMERKLAYSASKEPNNPALELLLKYRGKEEKTYLFSRADSKLELKDFIVLYRYMPRSNVELLKPEGVEEIQVELGRSATVMLQIDSKKVNLRYEGEPYYYGDYAFVFRKGPREEKEYISFIKVYSKEKTREAVVKVNKPFSFMGYKFYQSDYNPENLNFSGIMLVKEPGEPVLYVGFAFIILGTVLNLIYRRKQWK